LSALLGGGIAAWFFIARVEDGYIWASELSSLLLMYVGFLGASMATKEGRHIQVDAIRKGLSLRLLPLYNGVGNAITVLFCGLLLAMTLFYMKTTLEAGNQLEATELPEVLMALPIALCLVLMVVRFSARASHELGMYLRGEEAPPLGPETH
jgi:C4-dicarboxylate transporter DctQ subunit